MQRIRLVIGLAVLGTAVFAQPMALSGTWVLNVAKSKFIPGPPPKSEIRTYEVTGQQVKGTIRTIDANGNVNGSQFAVNYDGKDYPFTGSPNYDTLAMKPIDDLTAEIVQKKSGKVVFTGRRVLTRDGKTMTISGKGAESSQPTEIVMVFEKQ